MCFPFSRGVCKDPNCKDPHVSLTAEQKLKRDRREEKLEAEGKPIGYARSPKQAKEAKANVAANAGKPGAPGSASGKSGSGKGKGGGKGKDPNAPCWNWTEKKECEFGARCKFKKNTPGHP